MPRHYRHLTRDARGGWVVQLVRRGRHYRGYFDDRGDSRAALSRAIAWRDKMLEVLPPPRRFKLSYRLNTTGVIGVHICRDRRGQNVALRYAASWADEHGRDRKSSFSVAKYGARQARALAIQARQEALKRLLRPPAGDGDPQAAIRRTLVSKDKMIASLPPPLRLHGKNARNTSGVIGVFLARNKATRRIPAWVAVCSDGRGHKQAKSFSTAKYGYARARTLAIQARRRLLQALRERLRRPVSPSARARPSRNA